MKRSPKQVLVLVVLGLILLLLQVRLWFGEGSLRHAHSLGMQVDERRQENRILEERNALMAAEVKDLKEGMDAVEEIARKDLGMTKEEETYFILQEKQGDTTGEQ